MLKDVRVDRTARLPNRNLRQYAFLQRPRIVRSRLHCVRLWHVGDTETNRITCGVVAITVDHQAIATGLDVLYAGDEFRAIRLVLLPR